jgi:hypothetical protein
MDRTLVAFWLNVCLWDSGGQGGVITGGTVGKCSPRVHGEQTKGAESTQILEASEPHLSQGR